VVVAMFVNEATERTGLTLSGGLVSVLAITIFLTLLMGIYPDPFIDLARQAAVF
jgi:NADH:ubiquinone oxidoreductase subunit 2 (subunit N)